MEKKFIVCVKAIIVHEGKMLLIQRAVDAHVGGGTWEPVGGKIEFGEEIEPALKREVKEEVGLNITVGKLLFATTFQTDPTRQVVLLTYLCHTKNNQVTLSFEHKNYQWSTKEQLRELLPESIIADFEKNNVFQLDGLL